MALECLVLNKVVQVRSGCLIVVCWDEVAGFWDGEEGEAALSDPVPANQCLIRIATLKMINLPRLLPKLRRNLQQFLHPDILPYNSILHVKLAGHDD